MADGSIVFSTALDNKGLERELAKAKRDIEKLEDSIASKEAKKSPLIEQAQDLEQKMKSARAEVERYRAAWASGAAGADKEQSAAIARAQQLEAEHAKVAAQIDKIDATLQPSYEKLDAMKEKAGGIAQELGKAGHKSERMSKATERAEKSLNRFKLRLREVVRSALVFTLITQSLAKLREWVGKVIRSNDEASAAVARLKGALLTLAQPIVEVIIPVFADFVNLLANLIGFIAGIVATIFGMTAEEAENAAGSLYDEIAAIDGVGSAAKKAGKSLAGFDEINKLVGESASTSSGINPSIKPDLSAIKELPALFKSFLADLEVVIQDIKFAWSEGNIGKSKNAWIVILTSILGAVIGGIFGGIWGAAIGLLMGASIGITFCTFLDKTSNPEGYKAIFITVLSAMLGATLGAMFFGIAGGVVGLLLGASIAFISMEFFDGKQGGWDEKDAIMLVLGAILGGILGAVFGGISGGIIGLLLGASITFAYLEFGKGKIDKDEALASFRIALFAILGLVLGTMLGGLAGGVIGLVLGMTIGFATVGFDKNLSEKVQSTAKKALKIAISAIVGALIGAVFGGGIFGGIVGGIIGLTFGLAITLGDAKVENKSGFGGGSTSGGGVGRRNIVAREIPDLAAMVRNAPRLATGAVIPPNREFLAVLGDQKRGTNIEAPVSEIEAAVARGIKTSGANTGAQEIVIRFEGSMAQLARILKPYLDAESSRKGVKLVGGNVW